MLLRKFWNGSLDILRALFVSAIPDPIRSSEFHPLFAMKAFGTLVLHAANVSKISSNCEYV